jgi:hypothetical protein
MSVNIIIYLSKYNQCKMLIFVEKDLAAVAHMADTVRQIQNCLINLLGIRKLTVSAV